MAVGIGYHRGKQKNESSMQMLSTRLKVFNSKMQYQEASSSTVLESGP
jgi:hypothetical protein